ncbi:MAG: (2Fe-2S)-binding protein [Mesoaciditoga sp.]|uniref:FAD-dependent oxidoreductase n=2 Tax=Athalassotoga sp. TaxID=2022597 RepID=UPI000CAA7F7C|nr:MAG: (2Fe-2S)-binding protein [Mesoaciditoga sp.]
MMYDAVIIGGGPAGMSAATILGDKVKTLIIDENDRLGGQLVKQTHKFFGDHEHYASMRGFEIADKLLKEIQKKPVLISLSSTVIGIYPQNTVAYVKDGQIQKVQYKKLLLATGAMERQLPFVNSDLPGVYGAGAIQTLMNQYGIFPGKRFLIVGSGNIGLILAYQLAQSGVEVKMILEALDKVGGYEVHANKVKRLGIPILTGHTIVRAIGDEKVEGAVIARVDKNNIVKGTEREVVVDTICVAVGLTPLIELAEQSGAKVSYIPELGGYVPLRDERMRTTNKDVFVAGDLSSIEEATTAMMEGKIAAMQMVEDLTGENLEDKIYDDLNSLAIFRSGPKSAKIRTGLEKMGINVPKIDLPKPQRFERYDDSKLHAVIECTEEIPCNSCEYACKFDAIKVGININSVPSFDPAKCTGCALCVTSCPGLAIFMKRSEDKAATLGIPYEFLPLPKMDDKMWGLDREGNYVCDVKVKRVVKNPNKTNIVYVELPSEFADMVRHVKYPSKESPYVCRCEEVTLDEIEKVIDLGVTDFEELKRLTRVTMGPCNGKNCKMVVLGILSKKTGIPISSLSHGTSRPPTKPIEFRAFLKEGEE